MTPNELQEWNRTPMPADLTKPFAPACCEGSAAVANEKSAQSCGCDEGANWTCQIHRERNMNRGLPEKVSEEMAEKQLLAEKRLWMANIADMAVKAVRTQEQELDRPTNPREEKRKWVKALPESEKTPTMRTFETGATRNVDEAKHDPEGFNSPLVELRFCEYMTKHRVQADGALRASDNWQKGIPKDAYMKSMYRHMMDVWLHHRGLGHLAQEPLEEALCALRFNVDGYLFETLAREK